MWTEKEAWKIHGLLSVVIIILLFLLTLLNFYEREFMFAILFICLLILFISGLTMNRANEALIVLFFGRYVGSIRKEGLVFTYPFSKRIRTSLKEKIFIEEVHVNRYGDTFHLKMYLFYKIVDSAKALLKTDNIDQYMKLQSEISMNNVFKQLYEPTVDRKRWQELELHIILGIEQQLKDQLNRIGIKITDLYVHIEKQKPL